MNKELNLVHRFLSDTPDFWKVIDLIGLFLVAVAGFLADNGFNAKAITVAGGIGAALCLVSKFAKKDTQLLKSTNDPAQTIIENLPEFQQQAGAVIKSLKPVIDAIDDEFPETPAETPKKA